MEPENRSSRHFVLLLVGIMSINLKISQRELNGVDNEQSYPVPLVLGLNVWDVRWIPRSTISILARFQLAPANPKLPSHLPVLRNTAAGDVVRNLQEEPPPMRKLFQKRDEN